MKIKIAEAPELVLDYWVAKCQGLDIVVLPERRSSYAHIEYRSAATGWDFRDYSPSTNWAQGGPIICTEGIDLHQHRDVISSLYEYNDKRWHDLTSRGKTVEIVCRQLLAGPGRFIRETKQPGKHHGKWLASYDTPAFGWKLDKHFLSETPLIAAMRCYLSSLFGDELDLPDEFLTYTAQLPVLPHTTQTAK